MPDLIARCAGVLSQAERMVNTQQPQIVAAANDMVHIAYSWAIEERDRWADAREKVGALENAFGTNPQIAELAKHMTQIVNAWQECASEFDRFLSSI